MMEDDMTFEESTEWPSFDEVLAAARSATVPTPIGSAPLPAPLPPSAVYDVDLDELLSPNGLSPADRDALSQALEPLPEIEVDDLDPSHMGDVEEIDVPVEPFDDPAVLAGSLDIEPFSPLPEPVDTSEVDELDWSVVSWADGSGSTETELPEAPIAEPIVEPLVFEVEPDDLGEPEAQPFTTEWLTAEPETSTLDAPAPPVDLGDPVPDAIDNVTEIPSFDSVATADAIENDLNDLFAFTDDDAPTPDLGDWDIEESAIEADFPEEIGSPDNVVQLHDVEETTNDLYGLDADTVHTPDSSCFVTVALNEEKEDPWAHMRPDEFSDVKTGFWANRPRFFGGDERKRRRAQRKEVETQLEARSGIVPTCPSCGAAGRVDLDDPVGHKLHASCESCDHVWTESYGEERRSA